MSELERMMRRAERERTARKEAERLLEIKSRELYDINAELQNARDELESRVNERTAQLEEALAKAKAATDAKTQFLANMSHEIRTPMTAILGFAETLSENLTQTDNVDAVSTIRRNGEHLLHLINDILDLSKIESGKFEIENIECSTHELFLELEKLMQVRADAKGLDWKVELRGEVPATIVTDPTRLRQILINLIGNAIKFTEVGSVQLWVELQQTVDGPVLQMEVVDTGIGMTQEQQDRLFRPFTQADNSMSRKFGGTGLGLTISKRFAQMLGGDIRIFSEPQQGSTFVVTVALGSIENVTMSDRLERRSRPRLDEKGQECSLDGHSILLVEDGPDNQRLISFLLKKAGALVDIAENGELGYQQATQALRNGTPYDVVLMDMQMPVMDGYTAVGELRKTGYDLPIIALTAHAMTSERQRCLDIGCDDFATKPIDRKRLLQTVHSFAELGVL